MFDSEHDSLHIVSIKNQDEIGICLRDNKIIDMSFSMTGSDAIWKHPANTSTSKQVHLFSKTKRMLAPNPECPNAFYTYDSQLSDRKAAIGIGDKSDFTKSMTVSPPATRYQIKNFLELSRQKGKSFGVARDRLPDNSYLIPQMRKVPGPNKYEQQKKKKNNYYYTMRPQTVDFVEKKKTYREAPGPGEHQAVDMEPKSGRFSVGKYTDHRFSVIHPKGERFRKIKQTPGPPNYQEGDNMSNEGKYVLSNHHSNGRRVFSRGERRLWSKTIETPGPGSYTATSDFGHYGDAKYYQTLRK